MGIYALLWDKSQTIYGEMIIERSSASAFQPDPNTVISDFELAAFNAVKTILGEHVNPRGYFYQLTQNTWRRIQSLGLFRTYENKQVKLFCSMMDGLAFLPLEAIQNGQRYLTQNTSEGLEGLIGLR